MDLKSIESCHRLLFNVPLLPLQGTRFQPTGFPNLGAATYQAGNVDCLLVESAQSMANRLELQIWDDSQQALKSCFNGLSYVRVEQNGKYLTSTITEAHRMSSSYILEGADKTFLDAIKTEFNVAGDIDRRLMARVLFKYDMNALIHGVFIAKSEIGGGRLRVARALSAFIEAYDVNIAASGGVKNDHIDASGDTGKGFGNVPFSREEYTSKNIVAYFSIDLDQLRGYGLTEDQTNLLLFLSLYKIRSLLAGGLRLRTACDFLVQESYDYKASNAEFYLPSKEELESKIKELIKKCQATFATESGITLLQFESTVDTNAGATASKKAPKGKQKTDDKK